MNLGAAIATVAIHRVNHALSCENQLGLLTGSGSMICAGSGLAAAGSATTTRFLRRLEMITKSGSSCDQLAGSLNSPCPLYVCIDLFLPLICSQLTTPITCESSCERCNLLTVGYLLRKTHNSQVFEVKELLKNTLYSL